jgi:hypothetical protein
MPLIQKIKGPNFQAPPSIHTSHYHGNSTKMNHNLGLLFLRFFFQAGLFGAGRGPFKTGIIVG